MTVQLDDPAIRESCRGAPCETTLVVEKHGLDIPPHTTDLWFPHLDGKGAKGDEARILFSVARPWDVHWQPREQLHVRRVISLTPCGAASTDGEPSTQSATEIRDSQGKLLLLNAPDVPLAPGGKALVATGFGAELTVSWTDLKCPSYQEGRRAARRAVGIAVVDAKGGGGPAVVTWGLSGTLEIGGAPYVLAVNQGWVPADGVGCGRAALTIYRSGYLNQL